MLIAKNTFLVDNEVQLNTERTPDTFVPFAYQGANRKHTIRLQVDFSELPEYCPAVRQQAFCCGSHFRPVVAPYSFSWGDTEQLECVVSDTPQLWCECGKSKRLVDIVALKIKSQSRAVRQYYEFRRPDDLAAVRRLMSANDVNRVEDFATVLHQRRAERLQRQRGVVPKHPSERRDPRHQSAS